MFNELCSFCLQQWDLGFSLWGTTYSLGIGWVIWGVPLANNSISILDTSLGFCFFYYLIISFMYVFICIYVCVYFRSFLLYYISILLLKYPILPTTTLFSLPITTWSSQSRLQQSINIYPILIFNEVYPCSIHSFCIELDCYLFTIDL